jgi:hypothetical protein
MIHQLKFYFILFLLAVGFNANAQTWEVGLGAGGAGYMGDLNPKNPLKISGFSAGAYVKANFDPYWGLGLHYQYGKIRANDANSNNSHFKQRNLNFYSPLNEVSLQLDFNFFDYFAGGGRKNFSPYLFAGVGGVFFSPRTKINGDEYKLQFYETEGSANAYKNYAISIPYGLGMHFKLKRNWGLFTQIGYRTVFTDYLDDVSGYYPNPDSWGDRDAVTNIRETLSFGSPVVANYKYNSQRGDLRKRDTYMFVNVGISYTFSSAKCYIF